MNLKGKVTKILEAKIEESLPVHFSLIDPAKIKSLEELKIIADGLYNAGTDAFLVGGTLGVSREKLDNVLDILDKFDIPKILFPSNINILSEKADAILFLSLLNSDDIYYIIGAQLSAAPLIKQMNLEVLPTAYLIIGHGGTAAHVGRARIIPYENIELAVAYAMAAEYMGMRYVYLEAGSGAPNTVKPEMIKEISANTNLRIIVGGGIRNSETAINLFKAGADIIVTGNIIEDNYYIAQQLIKELKKVKR